MRVVRVGGDDGQLRPWHYIYVYSIKSSLEMRVRYNSRKTKGEGLDRSLEGDGRNAFQVRPWRLFRNRFGPPRIPVYSPVDLRGTRKTQSKSVVQSTLLTPRPNRFTRALPPLGSRDPPCLAEGGALPYKRARHCPGFSLPCRSLSACRKRSDCSSTSSISESICSHLT